MIPTHEERNRIILGRTLSAISHLYAAFSGLVMGLSLLAAAPTRPGIHGSRAIGWMSLSHGVLYLAAGWMLWRPRRGAWLVTLMAAAGSVALSALDFMGRRLESIPIDGLYAPVALAIFLQVRRRA